MNSATFTVPDDDRIEALDPFEYRVLCRIANATQNNLELGSIPAIAQKCKMSVRKVQECLRSLEIKGLIAKVKYSPTEAKELISGKTPQSLRLLGFTTCCEWCNGSTVVLQEHHYPVPKSQGGTETVFICPNCHSEFHQLVDTGVLRLSLEA